MRITIATIVGLFALAGGVLFFPPLRAKADLVLFNAVSASDEDAEPCPLEKAADTTCDAIKSLWSKDSDDGDDAVDEDTADSDTTD